MNWEAIGAIGEIVGSLAVIVTLALLIVQLKTNSIMIQNSTTQSSQNAMSEWARQLTQNPELYLLYRAGLKDDSQLSKEDRGRFDLILFQVFQSISGTYAQFLNAGMEKVRWEAELTTFGNIYKTPGGRASWERQKFMLDHRFPEEVAQHFSK